MSQFWQNFALVGFAGFGIGVGLLIGAFVVRGLRRFMREEFPRDHRDHRD